MVWDGLPFSTRAEFAGLVLFLVVFLSREPRQMIARILSQFRWRGVLKPLLVAMCAVKFISFAWAPMDAGFVTCYRSLYQPLEDESACEKSFEAPFTQGSGVPFANFSRVDKVADFGTAQFDWNLPFMNDFPRLRYLWLDRFPFSANFAARLRGVEENEVLPIFGIGELSVTVNRKQVLRVEEYSREFLAAIPLPAGTSSLSVRYEYRDEEITEPENEPTPKGPYAQLKVGEPITLSELEAISKVRVTGDVVNQSQSTLADVTVQDRSGNPVELTDLNRIRTLAEEESDTPLRPFDLEILIPASALAASPLTLNTEIDGQSVVLGTITADENSLTPRFMQSTSSSMIASFSVSLTTDRESLVPLAPGERNLPPIALRLLQLLLDALALTLLVGLAYVLFSAMRSDLLRTAGLALLGWLTVEPLYSVIPSFAGGGRELVIPYAIIAALAVLLFRQRIRRFPLPFLLPLASVLSAQKVFEHLHFNHPGHGDGWWGQLIYQWRDSDWFTNHGLSRAIFTGDIFKAGETVFYVRAAPRYLLYFAHLLLGENDVLIGLISLGVGFAVVLAIATRFANAHHGAISTLIAVLVAYIGMIFLGDQNITAFGFLVTSEYSSWILLLGIGYYLLDSTPESRIWVTNAVAAVLAILVQFRPNLIFAASTLLILLLLTKVDRSHLETSVRYSINAVVTFVLVVSLSLIHNLYFGARFVMFTSQNFADWILFSWTDVWSEDGFFGAIAIIWMQFRGLLYWRIPNDASYAIVFWGAQFCLAMALFLRYRKTVLKSPTTLIAAMPLTYVIPMLNFKLESYYPRHLVAASLLSLVSGLLIWPRSASNSPELR
jgi:hypothetical protein